MFIVVYCSVCHYWYGYYYCFNSSVGPHEWMDQGFAWEVVCPSHIVWCYIFAGCLPRLTSHTSWTVKLASTRFTNDCKAHIFCRNLVIKMWNKSSEITPFTYFYLQEFHISVEKSHFSLIGKVEEKTQKQICLYEDAARCCHHPLAWERWLM